MKRNSLLLVAALLFAGACSSDSNSTSSDPLTINIQDNKYTPAAKTITAGQTLTWSWIGNSSHSVTFTDIDSGIQPKGSTFSHTFNTPGVYAYHCMVHGTAMSGTITVSSASSNGITY